MERSLRDVDVGPYRPEQLVALHEPSRPADQDEQDLESLRRQTHRGAFPEELPLRLVQPEAAELVQISGFFRRIAHGPTPVRKRSGRSYGQTLAGRQQNT